MRVVRPRRTGAADKRAEVKSLVKAINLQVSGMATPAGNAVGWSEKSFPGTA